jgi:hypothetical protein
MPQTNFTPTADFAIADEGKTYNNFSTYLVGSAVWLQPHHRINHKDVFQLIILITIPLASSNNTLPDDGD